MEGEVASALAFELAADESPSKKVVVSLTTTEPGLILSILTLTLLWGYALSIKLMNCRSTHTRCMKQLNASIDCTVCHANALQTVRDQASKRHQARCVLTGHLCNILNVACSYTNSSLAKLLEKYLSQLRALDFLSDSSHMSATACHCIAMCIAICLLVPCTGVYKTQLLYLSLSGCVKGLKSEGWKDD